MNRSWKVGLSGLLAAAAALAALLPAASASAAMFDQAGDKTPATYRYVVRLEKDEALIASARADRTALAAQLPADEFLSRMVQKLEAENADYRYREAVRTEQYDLLQVAIQPDLAQQVVAASPPALAAEERVTYDAWYAWWRLAGIDEYNLVRIHPHGLDGALPSGQLQKYYQAAASHYQLDWTYLASINFIESDFGRVNGPSSAGALGPMQFMPATWDAYGQGGDVNNPKDAIDAAARYLFLHGALRNIDTALFAYNHDYDYVQAVKDYAEAIRQDPTWLDRLYYWNTAG